MNQRWLGVPRSEWEPAPPPPGGIIPHARVALALLALTTLLGAAALLASFIPVLQDLVVSVRFNLMFLNPVLLLLALFLSLPIALEVSQRFRGNKRVFGYASRPIATWVLDAVGLPLLLASMWLSISILGHHLPAQPDAARAYFLIAEVRQPALFAAGMGLTWLGSIYAWLWYLHHRPRVRAGDDVPMLN